MQMQMLCYFLVFADNWFYQLDLQSVLAGILQMRTVVK